MTICATWQTTSQGQSGLLWVTDWAQQNVPEGTWMDHSWHPGEAEVLRLFWTSDGEYVDITKVDGWERARRTFRDWDA